MARIHSSVAAAQMSAASIVKALFAAAVLVVPLPGAAQDDAPRILTLEDKIARCAQDYEGQERSDCLGTLAVRNKTAAPCDLDPSGVCRKAVGTYLMQQCGADASWAEEKQVACRMAVAVEFKSADACDAAQERGVCLSIVAGETRDPSVITDRVADPEERDDLLTTYVGKTGDETAIARISDNLRADQARIMALGKKAADGDPNVDASLCDGLRGGYGDKHAEDLDAESYQVLCRGTVNLAKAMRSTLDTAETPAERAKAEAKIAAVMQAIERGELTARDMAGLPPEEDFDALDKVGDETRALAQDAAANCRIDEALQFAGHLREVRPGDSWLTENEPRLQAEARRRDAFTAAYMVAIGALDRVGQTRNLDDLAAAERQANGLLALASPACPDEAERAQQLLDEVGYAREALAAAPSDDGGFTDDRADTGDDTAAADWGAGGGFVDDRSADNEATAGSTDQAAADPSPADRALAAAKMRYADEVRACDFGGAGQVLVWMEQQGLDPAWAADQRPRLAKFELARQDSLRQIGMAQQKIDEALAQSGPYTARSRIADARLAVARAAEASWCDAQTIRPLQQQVTALASRIDSEYAKAQARSRTAVPVDTSRAGSNWRADDRASMEAMAQGLLGILQQSARRRERQALTPDEVFERFRRASPTASGDTRVGTVVSPPRTGTAPGPGAGGSGSSWCDSHWADLNRKSREVALAAQRYQASAGDADRFKAALGEYRAACRSLRSSLQQWRGAGCRAPFDPGQLAAACP